MFLYFSLKIRHYQFDATNTSKYSYKNRGMKSLLSPVLLSPSFICSRAMGALSCRPLGMEELFNGYCVCLCVRNQDIILVCCNVKRHIMHFVLIYTRVFRHAYRTSFRVWFNSVTCSLGKLALITAFRALG